MTTTKPLYQDATPPSTVSLTVTGLATLASGSSATSNAIDEHTLLDNDLYLSSKISYTTTLATAYVSMFVSGSLDNTLFADSTGPNDVLIGTLQMPAGSTLYNNLINVLRAWPGMLGLPPYLKIRFQNNSGSALTAATIVYNGLAQQTA